MKIFKDLLGPSLIGLMVLLSGCARTSRTIEAKKLMTISVGMNKAQVVKNLGEPTVLRSSVTNDSGQLIECYEYEVDKNGLFEANFWNIVTYWLYFTDGILVRFHKAGDFGSFQPPHPTHHISEVRYR